MKQWLYRIQPVRMEMLIESTPEEDEIVGQHFEYLKSLISEGIVILAGRTINTDPSSFGIVIFEANSQEQAMEIMTSDPAVEKAVFKAELFPYSVALKN